MHFTIKAFSVLAAVAAVYAAPAPKIDGAAPAPTLTTQTFTFTGTKIFETIVSEPPYWLTDTTTFLWTQTQTNWVLPTATPKA